jgi:zinc protease
MSIPKLLVAAMVAVLVQYPVPAQKKATTAVAPSLKDPVKVTSVEGITEYKLDNGLRVLLFPDPSKPTITVNITYMVGSRVEGYGETGMAHLLEHMVFKGSTKHPNIPQELTSHGCSPNGTTWYDRTNYYETFNGSDENLNWALDLESDRMVNSFIAEKDLKSEFSVVRNEFEMGENYPSSVLMERVLSTAYLWHNYGKSTIGSKEDIERVPIQNLQAFYKKYYQPDNAILLVAGKIDEAKTLVLVNKYFGVIPRPTRALERDYTVEPIQDGERQVELRRVGDVQSLACTYHIAPGSHADYPSFDVINEVLTNQPNGRLYQSLVKMGKATAVWGWSAGLRDPGFLYINADVLKERSLDSAKEIFYATIAELKSKPVTQEEVDKAKNKLVKDFEEAYRSSSRIGLALSEYMGTGDWRLAFIYRDNLKKVTAADVNRVVKEYLVKSNRTTGIFIPTTEPKRATIPNPPDVAALVKDYKGGAALADAEAFDPSPENIEKRTERGSLPGGAKYALLTKTTRGNTVEGRITIRMGDEKSLENMSVVSSLTASMLKRGTKNKTMAQINEALDKLSSTLNVYGGGQAVIITFKSTKQNFPEVLNLVDEMLRQPNFTEDEFKTLKEENISNLEQERSEPTALASREFNRILNPFPKGHIKYAMTVEEEIEAVKAAKLEDTKKFYKEFYGGASTTIGLVGDFDATGAKEKLGKTFGNWSAPKSYARVAEKYDDITPTNKEIKTPDKKNAMYFAGMNLKLRDDNTDYPALMMGDFIFGGGFLNSRLATRIRQKEGISYGVGSFLQADSRDESGGFGSYAIYNPDNKSKLETVWKEEVAKMLQEGFTEDELKQAKSGMLQYRQTGRASDAQLAGKLGNYLDLNRTMAWDKSMDEKLEKLSVHDVNAAMKKYIDLNKISYIKAGDFK